ncbi:MAG: DUF4175 family protein [Planctomycetaceae bacterium]
MLRRRPERLNREGNGASMATVNPTGTLDAAFRSLHGRMRRVAALTGVGWCLAAGLLLLLLVGGIDWRWHVDDPLGRSLLISAGAGLWGLLVVCLVIVPVLRRPRAADTAMAIERLRPHWRGALVASVEFSAANCPPAAGAPQLQQALIARTQKQLNAVDLETLVRTRELRWAGAAAVLAALLVSGVVVADPASAGIALARLTSPRTGPSWPRQHTLVLFDTAFQELEPGRVMPPAALGERLLIYVDEEHGDLPEELTLHIATAGGGRKSQPLEVTTILDRRGHQRPIGVAVLPSDARRIHVRATGGDDTRMPWHTFEFARRPAVSRFKILLTPPAYTQQEPQEIVATSGDIRALVGSQVRLEAQLDAAVSQAEFQQSGLPPVNTQLSADGRSASIDFPVSADSGGMFAIQLLSRDGLRNDDPPRYRVEGIADREPTVALTQPATDLTVTPEAVVPVRVESGDDIGLVSVALSMSQPPGSAGEQLRPLSLAQLLARKSQIETEVSVAELGLAPGRVLLLRAEAADAYNLDGRHVVRSVPRALSIVTPEEKQREMAIRQGGIAHWLESAGERQLHALEQTRALQLQFQGTERLSASNVDALRRLAHEQAQLAEELNDAERGGRRQARAILEELAWNRVRDDESVARLTSLDAALERLQDEVEPALQQALSRVVHDAAQPGVSSTAVGAALVDVERSQSAANELLDVQAAQFAEWRRQHDLTRSLAEIAAAQLRINEETREVGRRTLTTALAELGAEDREALGRLGKRQAQTAEHLRIFENRLKQLQKPDTDSPESGESLSELDVQQALELLADGAVAAKMQRAAQLVAANSIAESAQAQQTIAQELEQLQQAVRGMADPAPETLTKQVASAESEAEALQQRQSQLRDAAERLAAVQDRAAGVNELRQQQQALAEETAQWAQRLRRQRFPEPAASADAAGGRMRDAQGRLLDDELAAALAEQDQAVKELKQARTALAGLRRQLESEQTVSAWSRFASQVDAFAERQSQLLRETVRLGAEQQRKGSLSRAQLRSLLSDTKAQQQLAEDLRQVHDDPAGNPVIRESLAPTIEQMRAAAARLAERQVDDSTRALQQAAFDQLRALHDDMKVPSASTSDEPGAADASQEPVVHADWPLAAQLNVLIRLQDEIGKRATALRVVIGPSGTPDDGQRHELTDLAARQARVAGLLEQLVSTDAVLEGIP